MIFVFKDNTKTSILVSVAVNPQLQNFLPLLENVNPVRQSKLSALMIQEPVFAESITTQEIYQKSYILSCFCYEFLKFRNICQIKKLMIALAVLFVDQLLTVLATVVTIFHLRMSKESVLEFFLQ